MIRSSILVRIQIRRINFTFFGHLLQRRQYFSLFTTLFRFLSSSSQSITNFPLFYLLFDDPFVYFYYFPIFSHFARLSIVCSFLHRQQRERNQFCSFARFHFSSCVPHSGRRAGIGIINPHHVDCQQFCHFGVHSLACVSRLMLAAFYWAKRGPEIGFDCGISLK